MSERLDATRPSATGPEAPADDDALPIALRFERGKGLLALRDHDLAPGVTVEHLELEIQNLRFPFDVTGGAKRFQSHKLRLASLVLSLDVSRVSSIARSHLAADGAERVTLVGRDGGIDAVVEGGPVTGGAIALRVLIEHVGATGIRLVPTRVRPLGPLAEPPLPAAARLLAAAVPGAATEGSGVLLRDPLRAMLRAVLPARGYRFPFTDGVVLSSIEVRADTIRFVFSAGAPAAGAERETLDDARRAEAERLAARADAILLGGDVTRAREELLVALDRAPGQPDLLERLAGIDAADPERAPSALAVADQLAADGPDRASALALAAMAAFSSGRWEVAADRLATLSEIDPIPLARALAARSAAARLAHRAPERAVRLYERALRIRREDPVALWALFDLAARLRKRDALERLVPQLLAASSVLSRSAIHTRLAQTWLDAFRDPVAARAEAELALRIDPSEDGALVVMATVLAQAGDAPRALRTWDRVARGRARKSDRRGEAEALLAAGRLWRSTGRDRALAMARFTGAIEAEPSLVDALRERATLRAEAGDVAGATLDFQRALDAAEVEGRADLPDLWTLVARHHAETGGDLDLADALLRRAREVHPNDPNVLALAESLFYLQGRHGELVDLLRHRAALEPEHRAARLREAARLADSRLSDHDLARALLDEATRAEPDDIGAWEARAALAREDGDDASESVALKALARLRARPADRATAMLALSEIEERLTDLAAAERWAARACEEAPRERACLSRLVTVRRRRGDALALADALGRLGEVDREAGRRAEAFAALLERARILLRTGRVVPAVEAVELALPLVRREERAPALRVLLEAAMRAGDHARARAAYEEVASLGVVTPQDRLAAAETAQALGDLPAAVSLCETVMSGPDPGAAERAGVMLLAAARSTGEPRRIAEILGRLASLTADATAAADLWVERASLQKEDLGDPRGAQDSVARALALDPDHGAALALGVEIAEAAGDPIALRRALTALARRPGERVAALERIARISIESLHDRAGAAEAYRALLQARPEHVGANLHLASVAVRDGRYDEAERHYVRVLAEETNDEIRLEASHALGRLRRDAGDLGSAEKHLRVAFSIAPDTPGLADELEALFRSLGRTEDLRLLYERRTRSADHATRTTALRRLAEIHIAASRRVEARAALEALATESPGEEAVWRDLWKMRLDAGDVPGAVEAVERLAGIVPEPQRARTMAAGADAVSHVPSGRDAARKLAEQALELDPSDGLAAAVLEGILVGDEDVEALLAHLGRRIARTPAGPGRAELRLRRAQAIASRLGEDRLEDALEEARLAWEEGSDEAVSLVADLARRLGRAQLEASAIRALAEAVPPGDLRRVPLLSRVATLATGSLADPELAFRSYAELHSLRPDDDEVRTRLAEQYEARGDYRAQAELLSRPGLRPGSFRSRAAAVAWSRAAQAALAAGDADHAALDLERALALAPGDAEFETRLDRALARAGRQADRLRYFLARIERFDRAARRAALAEAEASYPETERAVLRDRRVALGDPEAVREAAQRLVADGDQAGASALWELGAQATDDERERSELLLAAASAAEASHDEVRAERALRGALAATPDDVRAMVALAEWLDGHGGQAESGALWERVAGRPGAPRDALLRAASAYAESGEKGLDTPLLERAVAEEPEDPARLAVLAVAYRRDGRFAELVATLARRAELLAEGDPRAEVREEIARLVHEKLRDTRGAVRMLLGVAAEGARPRAARAARRALELARETEDQSLLVDALAEAARHCPPVEAARALEERARLLFASERGGEARRDLEEALRKDPDNPAVLHALGDLAQREGDHERVLDLFGRWLDRMPPDADPVPALRALVGACLAIGRLPHAVAHARRWADRQPDSEDAFDALARAAAAAGETGEAVGALERVAGLGGSRAVDARLRLADLLAGPLERPGEAARALLEVPTDDPAFARAAERAMELAGASEDDSLKVRALGALLETDLPPARRVATLMARAAFHADTLGNPEAALEDLRAARKVAPSNADVLLRLARLARRARALDECLDVLSALATAPDLAPDAKVEVHLAAADAAASLGRTQEARDHCRIAASLGRVESADAILYRVLDPTKDRAELYALEERRLSRIPATDERERRKTLRKLANLALEAGEDDAAERHLLALHASDPDDPEPLGELRRLYSHRGAWRSLATLLRDEAARLPDGPARADLLVERGRLLLENLGAEAEAVEAYEAALRDVSDHAGALEALADLAYRRADWSKVDAFYERLGSRTSLRPAEVAMRRALAAERSGKLDAALTRYAEAAALDGAAPEPEEKRARVALQLGRHADAAIAYAAAFDRVPERDHERRLALRFAQARALVAAGSLEEAVAPLENVVAGGYELERALGVLARVAEGLHRTEMLVSALSRLAEITPDAEARADLDLRIAEAAADADPAAALESLRAVLDVRPDDPRILRRLVDAGVRAGEATAALEAFETLWRVDRSAACEPELLYSVARFMAGRDEVGLPLPLLREAAADTDDVLVLAARVLAVGRRAPAEAAELLARAEQMKGADDVLARLARDLADSGAEPGLARRAAAAAVANDPGNASAHEALAAALDLEERPSVGARAVGAFLRKVSAPPPAWEPRPLPSGAAEDLVEASARGPLARALAVAAPCLAAGWADRTARGTPVSLEESTDEEDSWLGRGSAVRGPVIQAMALVPGVEVQVLVLDGMSNEVIPEGGLPPRLLLGGAFMELSSGARLFALVRGLLRIRLGEGVVPRTDPEEVLHWCRTLRRALVGASVEGSTGEAIAAAAAELPPAQRISLAKALDTGLKDATSESAAETLSALRRAAARLALTMTGDACAALEALAGPGATTSEIRAARVRGDPEVADLARFASGGSFI